MDYKKEYERWLKYATDKDIKQELVSMNEAAIEDAFLITSAHREQSMERCLPIQFL